ncbi:hypothetical protein DFP73DRAFT_568772 [Morchella snyderi]|nr:hypothetical protein DFP73DRAFT_568772 [Morchella snyderi]
MRLIRLQAGVFRILFLFLFTYHHLIMFIFFPRVFFIFFVWFGNFFLGGAHMVGGKKCYTS